MYIESEIHELAGNLYMKIEVYALIQINFRDVFVKSIVFINYGRIPLDYQTCTVHYQP